MPLLFRVYHAGYRAPGWLRPLVPSSWTVEEKSWNAFPDSCTTLMTSPALLGETSSVEILTVFRLFNQEEGFEENVFGLTEPSSNPEVIDIVANNVSDLSNISTSTGETIHGLNYSVLGWRSLR